MMIYSDNSTASLSVKIETNKTNSVLQSYAYEAIGLFIFAMFLMAMAENTLILLVYKHTPKLRTKTNYWIIALILCDCFIVLLAFPMLFISSFAEQLVFGDGGCQLDGFIVTTLGSVSIYLLTGLSIQRYCIMTTERCSSKLTVTQVLIYIAICVPLGMIWGLMPLFGYGSYVPEGIGVSCAPDWKSPRYEDKLYIGLMFIFVLFVPLIIMVFCYTVVLIKVWRAKINNSRWIQERKAKREIRVTLSIALTVVSFIVAWTPYSVVNLAGTFFDLDAFAVSPMLVQLPCLMAKTACVWNPIVYVCANGDYRKAIRKYLRKIRNLPVSETQPTSHSMTGEETKL